MNPRTIRRLATFVVVGLVVAACGDGDGAADGEDVVCEAGVTDADRLNFYNWSEYMDPDLVAAFEAETGVDVVESFYESNEAMLAQIQAGVTYDLIVPSDYMVGIMIEEGLLMPIQKDAVPNITNLAAEFASPAYDPGGEYSVAYQWGTTGLGVNLAAVGDGFVESWAIVFDPELTANFPGGVSLLDDPRETMGAALKYLGYSLNEANIDALQEAADLIANAKDYITTFDSDQYGAALVNGEVAVAHGYSGNMLASIWEADDPDNFVYMVPEEGGTLWSDNMAVPVGSAAPCTAHAFIDFLLDAENGAALTNWTFYASPNEAAEAFIDPEILEDETIYPSDELRSRLEIIADTGDFEINFEDYFAQAKN
ncbi:MAG TPA: spermidine/putrescine ABC transporter substrate-binding protein [Acidimicrobiia bacterium]|nr:spermidine/putrescine ABC transporter substrate-binding protein [Acidimicrobiia bacterium]